MKELWTFMILMKDKKLVKHKHRRNEVQRKRYAEDDRNTRQDYNKTFQSKSVSCSVCNFSMTQANYYKHKNTKKHKINLEKVSS